MKKENSELLASAQGLFEIAEHFHLEDEEEDHLANAFTCYRECEKHPAFSKQSLALQAATLYNIGNMYYLGKGAKQRDLPLAAQYFTTCLESSLFETLDHNCQVQIYSSLGSLFFLGLGVQKNPLLALAYYEQCANKEAFDTLDIPLHTQKTILLKLAQTYFKGSVNISLNKKKALLYYDKLLSSDAFSTLDVPGQERVIEIVKTHKDLLPASAQATALFQQGLLYKYANKLKQSFSSFFQSTKHRGFKDCKQHLQFRACIELGTTYIANNLVKENKAKGASFLEKALKYTGFCENSSTSNSIGLKLCLTIGELYQELSEEDPQNLQKAQRYWMHAESYSGFEEIEEGIKASVLFSIGECLRQQKEPNLEKIVVYFEKATAIPCFAERNKRQHAFALFFLANHSTTPEALLEYRRPLL